MQQTEIEFDETADGEQDQQRNRGMINLESDSEDDEVQEYNDRIMF